MVIETKIKYELKSNIQVTKWNKKFGTAYKKGDIIEVDYFLLKTMRDYRRRPLLCKCDKCGRTYKIRLCTLANQSTEKTLCLHCKKEKELNPMFGKKESYETKKKISDKLSGKNNPMFGKHLKDYMSEAKYNSWREKSKGNKRACGKRTKEQCEHIRKRVIEGYADGSRKRFHGNASKGFYKNILYQGTYELNFLKYLDSIKKLNLIERGPSIEYTDSNGLKHFYLSDYFIKSLNLVIEIKSSYFWNLHEDINILKMNAALKKYNYLLIINNDFNQLNKILNVNN